MDKFKENYDVTLAWRSFQLRPAGSPPLPPAYRQRIESSRPQFAERVRREYGVELKVGPFDTDTRPALVVEKFAQSQGHGEALHKAMMNAYWLQGRPIGNPDVLREVLAEIGLPVDDLTPVLEDPTFNAEVSEDIDMAHQYGISGVPALVFDNTYLVVGAQPYEVLQRVIEKIQALQEE